MGNFLEKGRLLYADNFRGSAEKENLHVCGTLRKDLKTNQKKVVSKKLKKGEIFC